MNERLKLAKKLLKDDGMIFVSIDDSQQAYLKILMDEIFGEENFVANIVWQKKNLGSGQDSKHLKVITEYILLYANNINKLDLSEISKDVEKSLDYKYEDEYVSTRGKYKTNQLDRASLTWSKGMDYKFEYQGKTYYPGGSEQNWKMRHQGKHAEKDWRWRWSYDKLIKGIEDGFVIFENNKIFTKQYQFVDNSNQKIERKEKFTNLIIDADKQGPQGTNVLKDIFSGFKVFDHPKPTNLLTHLLSMRPNQNARVLDFFAGSGTTGHAVLELNRQDGGNRSFTLVTNNQNNIGTKITYERLFRINKGEGTKGETFDWANKNESYKSNLNVYNINYFDVSLTQDQTTLNELIDKLKKLFKDFDINLENTKQNNYKLLLDSLLALKPQKADEQN